MMNRFFGMRKFFAVDGGGSGGTEGSAATAGGDGAAAAATAAVSTGDGQAVKSYFEGLNAENKAYVESKGWNRGGENGGPVGIDTVFSSLRSAETLIGKNNIPQPDPDKFDEWPGFKAAGVPDKVDGYKINRAAMPNGADGKPLPYDEVMEQSLLQAMHKGKVPAGKAQSVYDELVAVQVARAQQMSQLVEKDRSDTDAALTQAWGAQKDANIARAQNAWRQIATKVGVDPQALAVDGNAALGSVGLMKLGVLLADQMGEDVIIPADGRVGDVNTPAGALATFNAMDSDPVWSAALKDPAHPRHAEAVKRRTDLWEKAYPMVQEK